MVMSRWLTAALIFCCGYTILSSINQLASVDAQTARQPRLGDCLHFVLYYSEPTPDDPSVIGQHRAGFVSFVHEDGTVDLNYMTGRKPNEPDNPPDFWEHKIRRPHAWPPEPSTWHFCREEQ